MSAHTPGPWEWVGDCLESQNDYVIGVGDDGKQFGMHSAVLIESSFATRAEANRLLIAAAPELLAALIEARHELEQYALADFGEDYNNPSLNDAIAKATGGEA